MGIETIIGLTGLAITAGLGAASATGAIGPQTPKPTPLPDVPSRARPEVEDARRRALLAEGKARGPAANYLTGESTLGAASVSQKYLTGQ